MTKLSPKYKLKRKLRVLKNTFIQDVKKNVEDRIEVEIGDIKQEDFRPQFKVKRWDNEINFSMRAEEHPEATVKINIGDSWKDVTAIKINVGDTWKDVTL